MSLSSHILNVSYASHALYIIFWLLSGEFNACANRNISEGNQSTYRVSFVVYGLEGRAHSGARISALCSHAGAASRASHSAIGSSHCPVSCRYVCNLLVLEEKAHVQGVPVKHIGPRFRDAN